MTDVAINMFKGGMDLDTDISLLPADRYQQAYNFRLTSFSGNSNISLENVKGNENMNLTLGVAGIYIVGIITLRNYLIILASNSGEEIPQSNSYIFKVTLDNNNNILYTTQLYSDAAFSQPDKLNLSSFHKIKGVGIYESEDVQKVYWTDGYNVIRFCNINDPDLATQTVDKFELLPNKSKLGNVYYRDFVGGSLKSGLYQYSYQYFNDYGAETTFHPPCPLIPVSSSGKSTVTNGRFKGSPEDENTGKGILAFITDLDTSYDKIRIVSIFYNSPNGVPVIRILTEQDIDSSGVMYFTDTGDYLAELTVEEFTILSNNTFICKDIESKDNILFASNIEERYFDIDFDARAYRFSSANNSRIINNYNSSSDYDYLQITSGTSISNYVWTEYHWNGSTSVATGNTYTTSNIPNTYDCVNLYNNTALDGTRNAAYECFYQSNGSTYGGTGVNVSYTIERSTTVYLDRSSTGTNDNIRKLSINESDNSYKTTPPNNLKLTFTSDEVYRIGVVFFDEKGRSSFVKWIGDIRMPTRNQLNMLNTFVNGNAITADVLDLTVNITTSGTDADGYGWQIVKVKRDIKDRTVLSQGVIAHTVLRDSVSPYTLRPSFELSTNNLSSGLYFNEPYNDSLVTFISPEVLYTPDLLPLSTNNYFRSECVLNKSKTVVYHSTNTAYTYPATAGEFSHLEGGNTTCNLTLVEKYRSERDSTANAKININDIKYIGYTDDPENIKISLTGGAYQFVNLPSALTSSSSNYLKGLGCSVIVAILNGHTYNFDASLTDGEVVVVHYKQDIFTSQYGGLTYERRLQNEYEAASSVVDFSSAGSTTVYGDTYIAYLDVCRCYFSSSETDELQDGRRGQAVSYIPVETTINLDFTHGYLYSRERENVNTYLMRELPGLYITGDVGKQLEQTIGAYTYNKTYSSNRQVQTYFCKPLTFTEVKNYDCRIKYSNTKINGELTDSWTKFNVNDFLDVDAKYGYVSNIQTHNDKLFFWQEHSFGVLSVNNRALIQDNNPGTLVLGNGGVLDRYDYVSTSIGNINKFGIISTDSGLYWVDNFTKEIYRFNNSIQILSKQKNIQSYLNNINFNNVIGVYDRTYNEVLLSVLNNISSKQAVIEQGGYDIYGITFSSFTYNNSINIGVGGLIKIKGLSYMFDGSQSIPWANANLPIYTLTNTYLEFDSSSSNQYCYVDYAGYYDNNPNRAIEAGDVVTINVDIVGTTANCNKFKIRFYDFPSQQVKSNEVVLNSGSNTINLTLLSDFGSATYLQIISTAASDATVRLQNATFTVYKKAVITGYGYENDSWWLTVNVINDVYPRYIQSSVSTIYFITDSFEGNTLVFNENLDVFTGFYTFVPALYVSRPKDYITSSTLQDLYKHNTGNYGEYYLDSYVVEDTRPSTIKVIVNKDFFFTKVFDNLRFSSTSTDSNNVIRFYDVLNKYDTFDTLTVYNDYQNSGEVILDTANTDISRREREWTLSIPRNAIDVSETLSPDISNTSNLDVNRTFRERIRGKYAILYLTYNNIQGFKFNVPYIITKYRKSKR